MIRKELKLQIKSLDETGQFEGYASVFGNVDSDGEVIDKGAFKRTIGHTKGIVPILWQHNRNAPIGWNAEASEDDHGLLVRGSLMIDTEMGKHAHAFLKKGIEIGGKPGLSIGFMVPKDGEYYDAKGVRHFKEVALKEYSIVTFPANEQATVNATKGATTFQDLPLADESRAWDANAAAKRIREWAGGPDKENVDWTKLRKAYLWFDSSNDEQFGSYKLPIADVIDGSLKAVPRGIFAAAAALNGARTPTTIPAADKEKCKSHLNRYYKKMDKPSPFEDDGKAADFNSSLEEARAMDALWEERCDIDYAMRDAIQDNIEDESLDVDQKKANIAASISQYAEALTDWWSRYVDVLMADQDDEDEEDAGKHLKEGRTISQATAKTLQMAIGYLKDSDMHAMNAKSARQAAIGVLQGVVKPYYSNDVNEPNPVGGKRSDPDEIHSLLEFTRDIAKRTRVA